MVETCSFSVLEVAVYLEFFKRATNVDHAVNLRTHILVGIDPSWGLDGSAKELAGMTNPELSVDKSRAFKPCVSADVMMMS